MKVSPTRAWVLLGLLYIAGIFNAMDRPIIAILKPDMSADFGWTDADFGRLAAYTQFAAALSFLFTGWLVDKLGVRKSVIVGVTAWSLAAMAHGWARSAGQVVAARIGLGATEAVQTPLAIKTIATLFAPGKRSFAIGFGTALAAAGSITIPFVVPVIALAFGWRGALIFAGVAGFITLAAWLLVAHGINFDDKAELEDRDYSDDGAPYGPILKQRSSWAIFGAKALSDSTWWLMNFWLPDFYRRTYDLTTTELALPVAIAFAGSGAGGFLAGWVSTKLIERGWELARVRRTVMLVSALVVAPVPFVLQVDSFWAVAIMMGLVLAGHQGFSLSLFSIITDIVPRGKVGRVTALGAFFGNMGGMAIVWITGVVLTAGGGYTPLFVFAGASYLLAFAWLQLMLPKRGQGPANNFIAAP